MENKIQKLRRKKENAYSTSSYDQLYNHCVELAQLYLQSEDYENALLEYKEAEQAGDMGENPMDIALANRLIGEVYVDMQKPSEAIKHVKKYLEIAKKEGDLKEEQRALATMARVYFVLAESLGSTQERRRALEQAEKYNIRSLHICERLKEESNVNPKDIADMKARVYLNLGLVLDLLDGADKAVEYLEKAIFICRSLDLWQELYMSYTNLGLTYKHKDDTANALKSFDLGLSVAARLPEKAKSMCDLLVLKAGVLFDLPDFHGAKHALHKAYKLKTPDVKEQLEIEKKLKIVAAICNLEDRLVHIDETDVAGRRKIYELMGDGCAAMESYRKALEYYHLTLKCSVDLGETGKKVGEIYVSLAQTYKDLKDFDKAVEFYSRELAICENNPAEACNTTLSIADILEAKGVSSEEVISMYKSAQMLAREAKNTKLERVVLKSLLNHLVERKNDTLLSEIRNELSAIETQLGDNLYSDSDESDSSTEETGTPCIGDDICLETLSDSELDEEIENSEKPRTTRRPRTTFHLRRNEKGETPLHVACINGNLTLVRKLLDQGHPVDVRDNNGWLPLHEAANYGYVDVVRELLDKGASVNDRGGPSCGGVTPLLDAASCGHLLVMEVLLEKGACPTMRTNKGESVVDCLKGWRDRYMEEECCDLEGEALRDYNTMMRKVKTAIEKAGHKVSSLQPTTSLSKFSSHTGHRSSRETSNVISGHKVSNVKTTSKFSAQLDNSSSRASSNVLSDQKRRRTVEIHGFRSQKPTHSRHNTEQNAVSEYESAIKGLKHRTVNTEMPVSPIKESQEALVSHGNVVEDWLIDDLGESSVPRPLKRRRKGEEYLGQHLRSTGGEGERHRQRLCLPSRPSSSSSLSSELQDNDVDSVDLDNAGSPLPSNEASLDFEDISERDRNLDRSSPDLSLNSGFMSQKHPKNKLLVSRKRQTTLLSAGISREKVSNKARQTGRLDTNLNSPDNAQVDAIQSTNTVLPPTASNIAMLPGHRKQTMRVRVEGKLLLIVLPNDPNLTISWLAEEAARRYHSLEGMEPKLSLQTVDGALLFPQDPLSLVLDLGSEVHAVVTSWNLASVMEIYKEACAAAKEDVIPEVYNQLDACQATACLNLENFSLSTSELYPILKALAHHNSLQCVRLTGNCLSDAGLRVLLETLARTTQLRELDISCCNITSDGLSYMSQFVSQNRHFQALEVLDIGFNPLGDDSIRPLNTLMSALPTLHTIRMASISLTTFKAHQDLQLDRVEVVDISYNKIGRDGATEFLSKLNPDRICSLNFAGIGRTIACEIYMFLGQCIPHNLVSLNLSYCDVEDDEMNSLLECLQLCPKLQDLQLAGNTNLSQSVVQKLCHLQLSRLNLAGVECSPQNLDHGIENLCVSFTQMPSIGSVAPFGIFTNNLPALLNVCVD